MRWPRIALYSLALIAAAAGAGFASLSPEARAIVLTMPTDTDVLQWSQPQRDAGFRGLDHLALLAESRTALPASAPRALVPGPLLVIPGIDRYAADQRLAGLVILHRGRLVYERYGLGFTAAGRWTSFSVAKSFTSTLVGAALHDGAITSLDDMVTQYLPGLKGSAYDGVTVRQVLTMTSGVRWNENYEDPESDVGQFNNAKPDPGIDATVSYLRKLPRAHPPGTVWNYNTGETNLVGVLVAAATKRPLTGYLQAKIWQPAGMEQQATWLLSGTGTEIAGCCLQAATRDFARFGLFVLDNGRAGQQQIVPPGWFGMATRKQVDIGEPGHGYGFQWWTYDDGSVAAQGIFGQGIFIDPKRQLVIASNANWPRAVAGPQPAQREAFYRQVQALSDTRR